MRGRSFLSLLQTDRHQACHFGETSHPNVPRPKHVRRADSLKCARSARRPFSSNVEFNGELFNRTLGTTFASTFASLMPRRKVVIQIPHMLSLRIPRRRTQLVAALSCGIFVFFCGSQPLSSQVTAAYFKANCASCHTIGGGRLTGPDLKDVSARAQQAGKDRDWLIRYMLDPQQMINSGDPYAAQLLQDARGVVMPKIVGLTAEKAGFLLELIEAESLLEESQFKGTPISSEPFTPADVRRGLALFTGHEKLQGGGTMCMSCHRLPGVGGLGGGNLGPDLTRVYERLNGRAALSAWLQSPATPTMQSILQDKPLQPDEIHALVAVMEDRAANSQPQPLGASMVSFSILGLIGSVLVLFLFDVLWKNRLRSVRGSLVIDSKI